MRKNEMLIGFLLLIFLGQPIILADEVRPRIILGLSQIEFLGGETVGVQVDRVIRDIAWQGSPWDERVPPDRIPRQPLDLVPYMEGARTRELMEWARIRVLPLTPARAQAFTDGSGKTWYFAADGQGSFPFLIDPSKVVYPTVRQEGNLLILPDTHGFNMIAEQAYLRRNELYLAIACMDTPAKAEAALYLAQHGLNIYAPCDRFSRNLMGYHLKFPDIQATIIGSAPISQTSKGAVIGNHPVIIYLDEIVVAQNSDRTEGGLDQYCDTPWHYFISLMEAFNLELNLVEIIAYAGEAGRVVEKARILNAQVIAVRVWNEDDYQPVAAWLKENPAHRAVLLHSVAYDWGARLFAEFPSQTTFGDLAPRVER